MNAIAVTMEKDPVVTQARAAAIAKLAEAAATILDPISASPF